MKKKDFEILFAGVTFGVLGSLVANQLDRAFLKFGFAYDFIVFVLFCFVAYAAYLLIKKRLAIEGAVKPF